MIVNYPTCFSRNYRHPVRNVFTPVHALWSIAAIITSEGTAWPGWAETGTVRHGRHR